MVTFESDSLRKLSSPDQLELLNAIDHLRLQGINNYVSLPQIIVCGDQSSGKSSVLEAICGVSFPVKSNLCTRFPTELVLRRSPHISASVSIVPDESREESERLALSKFREVLSGFDGLPNVIESAKLAMGISVLGKAFSKDLLRVEISGPNHPHLTIVDLPGLIHSETKHQTEKDVKLIKEIVRSYMEEPRSIILAVVSAKNDVANQVVLQLARKADPSGTRTLGVITKPDTLIPGSDTESQFVSLARNQVFELRLGWHVLRNMDSDHGPGSLAERDAIESQFFSRGIWTHLPQSSLGIDRFRPRLSKLLLKQIASELPSLIKEINAQFRSCHDQLVKLGNPRTTETDQRLYLVQVSQAFQDLVKSAVDASYNASFFGDAKTEEGYQRRIRAVIQNLNEDFATEITLRGHSLTILRKGTNTTNPKEISEDNFLDHIEDLMRKTRGRELPGTFNPLIVTDLFREQCQPWEDILHRHVKKIWDSTCCFLTAAITNLADDSTANALQQEIFGPAMKDILTSLREKTGSLLEPHQRGHPITYNHYFTETLQSVRRERVGHKDHRKILQDFFDRVISKECHLNGYYNLEQLASSLAPPSEPDMNRFAAREAMDCLNAYYKVALKRFIDDVSVQLIEEGLVSKISNILSPMSVFGMDSILVTRIAGESEESRALREDLARQITIFGKGLETCKRFTGLRINGDSVFATIDHSFDSVHGTRLGGEAYSSNDVDRTDGTPEPETVDDAPEAFPGTPEPVPDLPEEVQAPPPEPEYLRDQDTWFALGLTSKKDKKKKKKKTGIFRVVEPEEEPAPAPEPEKIRW